MLFIPTMEDIQEEEMIIYCVVFVKPYSFTIARGFMNLYSYTCAHMVETETFIIFYQSKDFIPVTSTTRFLGDKRIWDDFNGTMTDEEVMTSMETINKFKPKCMSFFDDKVTLIMFHAALLRADCA